MSQVQILSPRPVREHNRPGGGSSNLPWLPWEPCGSNGSYARIDLQSVGQLDARLFRIQESYGCNAGSSPVTLTMRKYQNG